MLQSRIVLGGIVGGEDNRPWSCLPNFLGRGLRHLRVRWPLSGIHLAVVRTSAFRAAETVSEIRCPIPCGGSPVSTRWHWHLACHPWPLPSSSYGTKGSRARRPPLPIWFGTNPNAAETRRAVAAIQTDLRHGRCSTCCLSILGRSVVCQIYHVPWSG